MKRKTSPTKYIRSNNLKRRKSQHNPIFKNKRPTLTIEDLSQLAFTNILTFLPVYPTWNNVSFCSKSINEKVSISRCAKEVYLNMISPKLDLSPKNLSFIIQQHNNAKIISLSMNHIFSLHNEGPNDIFKNHHFLQHLVIETPGMLYTMKAIRSLFPSKTHSEKRSVVDVTCVIPYKWPLLEYKGELDNRKVSPIKNMKDTFPGLKKLIIPEVSPFFSISVSAEVLKFYEGCSITLTPKLEAIYIKILCELECDPAERIYNIHQKMIKDLRLNDYRLWEVLISSYGDDIVSIISKMESCMLFLYVKGYKNLAKFITKIIRKYKPGYKYISEWANPRAIQGASKYAPFSKAIMELKKHGWLYRETPTSHPPLYYTSEVRYKNSCRLGINTHKILQTHLDDIIKIFAERRSYPNNRILACLTLGLIWLIDDIVKYQLDSIKKVPLNHILSTPASSHVVIKCIEMGASTDKHSFLNCALFHSSEVALYIYKLKRKYFNHVNFCPDPSMLADALLTKCKAISIPTIRDKIYPFILIYIDECLNSKSYKKIKSIYDRFHKLYRNRKETSREIIKCFAEPHIVNRIESHLEDSPSSDLTSVYSKILVSTPRDIPFNTIKNISLINSLQIFTSDQHSHWVRDTIYQLDVQSTIMIIQTYPLSKKQFIRYLYNKKTSLVRLIASSNKARIYMITLCKKYPWVGDIIMKPVKDVHNNTLLFHPWLYILSKAPDQLPYIIKNMCSKKRILDLHSTCNWCQVRGQTIKTAMIVECLEIIYRKGVRLEGLVSAAVWNRLIMKNKSHLLKFYISHKSTIVLTARDVIYILKNRPQLYSHYVKCTTCHNIMLVADSECQPYPGLDPKVISRVIITHLTSDVKTNIRSAIEKSTKQLIPYISQTSKVATPEVIERVLMMSISKSSSMVARDILRTCSHTSTRLVDWVDPYYIKKFSTTCSKKIFESRIINPYTIRKVALFLDVIADVRLKIKCPWRDKTIQVNILCYLCFNNMRRRLSDVINVLKKRTPSTLKEMLSFSDTMGNTTAHIALKTRHYRCADILIENGCNMSYRNKKGLLPIDQLDDLLKSNKSFSAAYNPLAGF